MGAGGENAHQLPRGDKGRDRVDAAAEGLAEDEPVGPDVLMLMGEPAAGTPETGLRLHRGSTARCAVAYCAKLPQIAFGRDHDSGFALNGLDEHRHRYSA